MSGVPGDDAVSFRLGNTLDDVADLTGMRRMEPKKGAREGQGADEEDEVAKAVRA